MIVFIYYDQLRKGYGVDKRKKSVKEFLEEVFKGTGIEIAAYNSPAQIVISGPKDAMDKLLKAWRKKKCLE